MYTEENLYSIHHSLFEARQVLRYGMHLSNDPDHTFKDRVTNSIPASDVVNNAMQQTLQTCSAILDAEKVHFYGSYTVSALASIKSGSIPASLECLNDYRYFPTVWTKILSHHCLLATYDKLHDIIFSGFQLSVGEFIKYFKLCGLDYALNNGVIHVIWPQKPCFFDKKSSSGIVESDTVAASTASYQKSFHALNQIFQNLKPSNLASLSTFIRSEDQKIMFSANHLVLLQQIRGRVHELNYIKKIYTSQKGITYSDFAKFITSVNAFQQSPIKLTDSDWEEIVSINASNDAGSTSNHHELLTWSDKIYYKYKLEQVFHFDLINCLSQNIQRLEKRLNTRFDLPSFIDIATSSVALPNVLSRHILIQMSFDSLTKDRDLKNSSLQQIIHEPDILMKYNSHSPKYTDNHIMISEWTNRYIEFINYMVTLVFPVYESYFFITLYDLMLTMNSQHSMCNILMDMFNTLKDHLNTEDVYKEILYLKDEVLEKCNIPSSNSKKESSLTLHDIIVPNYENILKKMGTKNATGRYSIPKLKKIFEDSGIDINLYQQLVLSIYNHIPDPAPALISEKYLKSKFGDLQKHFVEICVKELLRY